MFRTAGWLIVVALALQACAPESGGSDPLAGEKLDCPTPAIEEYEGWGKSGISRICKIEHGPFVAWEGGYVHLRGQYDQGKKSGVWTWYTPDGRVAKQIDYSAVTAAPESGDN